MDKISPCMNCEKRSVGCHSGCKDFEEWQKSAEATKKRKNFARSREYMLDAYTVTAKKNMLKRNNNHWRKSK